MYFYMPWHVRRGDNIFILDSKQGDVTGDGIIDFVYLVGNKPFDPPGIFVENITIIIQDGRTGQFSRITLEANAGYNPKLFLGDFTSDGVNDIYVAIASGGSGGFGYYYIYSFRNNFPRKLFDFEEFNQEYQYTVEYEDYYKVEVISKNLDKKYILDISYKDDDYLDDIYDENGKLIKPIQGQVLGVAEVYPVDINRDDTYDLLAIQRIIGRYNADTLGFVQTPLKWDGVDFKSMYQWVAIPGSSRG